MKISFNDNVVNIALLFFFFTTFLLLWGEPDILDCIKYYITDGVCYLDN